MEDFQTVQQQFIRYIKDPDNHPAPSGIEDRRLKIYRELFFNNILGFLTNGFPVLASLYGEIRWQQLARQFFARHVCVSPYFVDISKEFIDFLQNEYEIQDQDPVFLLELAHYEWVELDISIRQADRIVKWWDGKSLDVPLCFSELAWLLSYPYPVHKITPEYQPQEKQPPTYLVVYRNSQDKVEFMQVNELTALLLTIIQQNEGMYLEQLKTRLIEDIPSVPVEQLHQGAEQIVTKMLQQQILTTI
ncbi:DNA-binding domain-containing protein [Neptunicella sp. SCSIO 80796]|uniref:HvfC family RiPP maturation protein n=1 Tax=Neptunicella plasticusilytica TaxID=3117012 RepID=UPI003A4DF8A8